MKDVVITGYSAITPFGTTMQEFAQKMFAGESAVGNLQSIVGDENFPVKCGALLPPGFYPPAADNNFSGEIETLLKATIQALIPKEEPFVSFDGIVFGTNEGLARFLDIQRQAEQKKFSTVHLDPEFGLQVITSHLKKIGQSSLSAEDTVICGGACTTGLLAIHYAAQKIRSGQKRRILVICSESRLRTEELLKLNALGALSRSMDPPESVSRPFSKSRSGFVRGEGAGAIILESRECAEERKAEIHGSVLSSAVTSDAWRLTDGREDLKCAIRAVEKALHNAKVSSDQINYINAHGTATLKNDRLETEVIKKVFGSSTSIPVSSLKSQLGHLNFACGIVEVIACLLMFKEQRIAPTINYHDVDPECDLDYVPNISRRAELNTILKIGFGFGGSNAAMVLGRI